MARGFAPPVGVAVEKQSPEPRADQCTHAFALTRPDTTRIGRPLYPHHISFQKLQPTSTLMQTSTHHHPLSLTSPHSPKTQVIQTHPNSFPLQCTIAQGPPTNLCTFLDTARGIVRSACSVYIHRSVFLLPCVCPCACIHVLWSAGSRPPLGS